MKTALTIAGSDSSGGAGIQADLKAMTMNGVFAMSAITALTAQNTTGVQGIFEVTPAFLGQQIDSVFTDIRPDAVKIGMVASSGLIEVIAERLQHYAATNIVVDPVMVATSGARLISEDAIATLEARLLPLATVLTPNIPEAEVLSGLTIASPDDMIAAGKTISERYGCAVLCKGGHRLNDANDLLYRDGGYEWFNGKRIGNPNTHGTGCTLSSTLTYGVVSCWMYVIGMGAAIFTGEGDIALIMVKAGLGVAALLILILSTVTTTFLDAYSAGISAESLSKKINGKYAALIVTVIGTVCAICFPMDDITNFLYLIGSVFAPMIAIQITDFFLLRRGGASGRLDVCNAVVWVLGFVLYRVLMTVDIPVGNTLPDMACTMLLCLIAHKIVPDKTRAS